MKKAAKFTTLLALTALSFSFPTSLFTKPSQTVQAAATSTPETSKNQSKSLDQNQINEVDKYVSIVNNQFVLDSSHIDPVTAAAVNQKLAETNSLVRNKGYVINTATKQINTQPQYAVQDDDFEYADGSIYEHEIRDYWWGVRHIFRSNEAIYSYINTLETSGIAAGVVALLPGMEIAGGITAAYLEKVASDVNTVQSLHSTEKIYLDVNKDFFYTCDVWHDW